MAVVTKLEPEKDRKTGKVTETIKIMAKDDAEAEREAANRGFKVYAYRLRDPNNQLVWLARREFTPVETAEYKVDTASTSAKIVAIGAVVIIAAAAYYLWNRK